MRHLNSSIYVDWLDPSMPARTCERTAENIKEKKNMISLYLLLQKVLLRQNGAIGN